MMRENPATALQLKTHIPESPQITFTLPLEVPVEKPSWKSLFENRLPSSPWNCPRISGPTFFQRIRRIPC